MGDYTEVFVGLDVAKLKNAVAIAEAGRSGEVRYLGEIENTPEATCKLVAKLSAKYARMTFAMRRVRRDMGSIVGLRSLDMSAWWQLRH